MIDFSTLKSLEIPEGNVTQIADASGDVLWKQAPSGVIVNVISVGGTGRVTIDGNTYTTAGTYEALESITVMAQGTYEFVSGSPRVTVAYVYLNNVQVASTPSSPPPTVNYSLSLEGYSEITIEYSNKRSSRVYDCYITAQ